MVNMNVENKVEFDAIQVGLASPENIKGRG